MLKNLVFPSLLFSAHAFNLLTISTTFSGRESGNGASSLSTSSHSDSVPIQRDLPESVVSLLDSSSTLAALTTLSIASSMLLSLPPNFFSSIFFPSKPLLFVVFFSNFFISNFLSDVFLLFCESIFSNFFLSS